jgi:hypothetical protein
MKALRKLILGETWSIPIGVALVLAAGLLLQGSGGWAGFVLLAGVILTLVVSLRRLP